MCLPSTVSFKQTVTGTALRDRKWKFIHSHLLISNNINLEGETLEVILPTIQGAALLQFLRHQIVGNLQTRYHTMLLQQNTYLTILLQQNTYLTILLRQSTYLTILLRQNTYLIILLHWNICSPADHLLDWALVELDKPWLEKKIIWDISHFWRRSARWCY